MHRWPAQDVTTGVFGFLPQAELIVASARWLELSAAEHRPTRCQRGGGKSWHHWCRSFAWRCSKRGQARSTGSSVLELSWREATTTWASPRCIHFDNTIIQSRSLISVRSQDGCGVARRGPDPTILRLQTGIVFEWDEVCLVENGSRHGSSVREANGEGYILPSEEQARGVLFLNGLADCQTKKLAKRECIRVDMSFAQH